MINGELNEQDWVGEEMKEFHKTIDALKPYFCSNCNELWPATKQLCFSCKKNKNSLSAENDMKPNHDDLPFHIKKLFEELTMVSI